MIIYLHGDDDFRSEEALRGYVEAFQKKHDPSGLSVIRLDGEKVMPEQLQNAIATQGLLSRRRLVVVRSLSKQRQAAAAEALGAFFQDARVPEEVVLIVWESGNPEQGKKKVPKVFAWLSELPARQPKKVGQDFQERFDPLVGRQLEQWVDQRAQQRQIRFAATARGLLVSLTGGDLRSMAQEIEKLSHYRPQGTVTDADVKLFVHSQLEPNIFELTDAIGERNLPAALQLLEQQFVAGAAPLYLVTMLTRHFRILRSVQAAGAEHPSTLARSLKLHPFVITKALRQVHRFPEAELVRLFDGIVSLDAKLKSGATDPEAELALFVAQACEKKTENR